MAATTDEPEASYLITATVDGDTVKASIDGKTETIRLIGVDTPETKDPRKKVQCFGEQAAAYTKTSLLQKRVTLESDESQDNRDKYGRLLRYIILDDGTNFNSSLIKQGYAYEYTYRIPYSYQSLFKANQAEAAAAQRGLWSPNTCNGLR
jgi:micrococcal nuclease